MTKVAKLMLVIALVAMCAVIASAQQNWGTTPPTNVTSLTQFVNKRGMLGGAHDLTGSGLFGKTAEWDSAATTTTPSAKINITSAKAVCSFCHTAHDNESEFADRQYLWAHEIPTTFGTAYTSPTLQGTENVTTASVSAKCLGCHDGTLAVSSGGYGMPPANADYFTATVSGGTITGWTQQTTGGVLSNAAFIVPLSRTHPVSIAYDTTAAQKHNLTPPASATSVDGNGIVPLFNGQMECATCHDPHIGGPGVMLRKFPSGPGYDAPSTATVGSGAFCLYCHQ